MKRDHYLDALDEEERRLLKMMASENDVGQTTEMTDSHTDPQDAGVTILVGGGRMKRKKSDDDGDE